VVPDRYEFSNLTATSYPWRKCLNNLPNMNELADVSVVLRKHATWQITNCKEHLYVKLVRCRKSSRSHGCGALPSGISNCSDNGGVGRCLVLNGIVYLKVGYFRFDVVLCLTNS
jgi:hypothetical protein